jgi:hypothetical protein
MKKFLPYITIVFFIAVAYFFVQTLSHIDWAQVQKSLSQFSWIVILPALALAGLDYFILGNYDYIGYRYFKFGGIKYWQVLISSMTCYIFTLNLGAMVGGVGFRLRIYSGWGISKKLISRIVVFATLTNWSGHALLLSIFFCFKSQEIYDLLGVPTWLLKFLGTIQFATVLTYFILCFKRYVVNFKGTTFVFPKLSTAFLQFFLSCFQWVLLSFIIYILIQYLGYDVALERIVFTSLLSSIAGVITHIPGGLGVLETIFLKVELGIPKSDMLAVLIVYRVVYYFIPLIMAIPSYLWLEYHQKKTIKLRNMEQM